MPIAGAVLSAGGSQRATVSVGTSVVTVTPPTGSWNYIRVINNHATAILSVNVNADPTASSGSLPAITWGNGQDIKHGDAILIPFNGAVTDIRLLSDTATTPVILNLIG